MNFLIYILTSLVSLNLFASLAYDYSASASMYGTIGIPNFDESDAANSHALPALLANKKENLFSLNLNSIMFDLENFDNILIASNIYSSQTSPLFGKHDPNPKDSYLLSLHGSFALFKSIPGKLNLSVYTPIDKLAEIQTGDPYLPEYPLYKKLERFMFEFNYAHKFETFNASIGALGGLQSSGQTFVVAKDNGSPIPSSAEISQNATPSLSLNFSLYKEFRKFSAYFRFQDEVKSKVENKLESFLAAGGGTININWQMDSLMFYDPRTFEIGSKFNFKSYKLITSIEYQDWSNFESPRLNLTNDGGILVSSDDEVNYEAHAIIIPTIAFIDKSDDYTLSYSISHKPSPLDLYDNRNGNTLDLDRTSLGFGISKRVKYLKDNFNLSFGLQYHYLHKQKINKSGVREDGDAGQKIGSGGYEARGQIYATSFGINWVI